MQVQVESVNPARRQVKLQIPADQVSRTWSTVIKRIGGRVRIPGFRPGKAPKKLLERRYGAAIREQVLERLLTKVIPQALDQAGLEPLGRPELDEVGEVRDNTELAVSFSCDVLPDIELDGYMGATYEIHRVEVDDEDIDAELEARRQRAAKVVDVDESAIKDDIVRVKYALRAMVQEPAEEPDWQERRIPVGSATPWLSDLVDGRKIGDILEGQVELPEDEGSELAGGPALIRGEILGIQRRMVPELDDALAQQLELKDLAELRQDAERECNVRANRRNRAIRQQAVLKGILDNHEIAAPQALVNQEIDGRIGQMFGGMNLSDNPGLSRYLEELRDSIRPEAAKGVQQALAVRRLTELHEIEVSDADIDAKIESLVEEMADMEDRVRETFATDSGRENLKAQLVEERIFDLILQGSTVKDGPVLHLRDPDPQPEAEAEEAEAETKADAESDTDQTESSSEQDAEKSAENEE